MSLEGIASVVSLADMITHSTGTPCDIARIVGMVNPAVVAVHTENNPPHLRPLGRRWHRLWRALWGRPTHVLAPRRLAFRLTVVSRRPLRPEEHEEIRAAVHKARPADVWCVMVFVQDDLNPDIDAPLPYMGGEGS